MSAFTTKEAFVIRTQPICITAKAMRADQISHGAWFGEGATSLTGSPCPHSLRKLPSSRADRYLLGSFWNSKHILANNWEWPRSKKPLDKLAYNTALTSVRNTASYGTSQPLWTAPKQFSRAWALPGSAAIDEFTYQGKRGNACKIRP